MGFSDKFFKKIEQKTSVDKNTILNLANKLSNGDFKDESTLNEVINDISVMTGKEVSEEKRKKIIETIVNDNVPKDIDKFVN
ncbi:MAG: stage VI sporulation protein F [Bacilli bacterium]